MEEVHPLAETYSLKTRVRVCGILVQNNRVLLARHKAAFGEGSFWIPPGGGLDYGEKVHDCVIREFKEETGLEVEVGRFLYINEFLRPPLHAIELFFEVKLVQGDLSLGSDPELATDGQLLEEVSFLSIQDIFKMEQEEMHPILHGLVNLDDLFIPRQIFLK